MIAPNVCDLEERRAINCMREREREREREGDKERESVCVCVEKYTD